MQLTFVVRNNDLTIDAILSTDSEASDMGTGLARLKRRMDYARFVADLLLAGIVSRKPKASVIGLYQRSQNSILHPSLSQNRRRRDPRCV